MQVFIASKHTADDFTDEHEHLEQERFTEISCLVVTKTPVHKTDADSCEEAICWIWDIYFRKDKMQESFVGLFIFHVQKHKFLEMGNVHI